MSEKTLNEVSKEATKQYSSHELRSGMLANAEKRAERAVDSRWKDAFTPDTQEKAKFSSQEVVELEKQAYEADLATGTEFAKDNAEQLHDLAVIEAHLGGVAINVEQPIEIGQKVEVKVQK